MFSKLCSLNQVMGGRRCIASCFVLFLFVCLFFLFCKIFLSGAPLDELCQRPLYLGVHNGELLIALGVGGRHLDPKVARSIHHVLHDVGKRTSGVRRRPAAVCDVIPHLGDAAAT